MCGIFGYLGKTKAIPTCIDGLKKLEYRGYDSAGIAGIHQGDLCIIKDVGKVSSLEKKVCSQNLTFDLAIAHTRWATHGEVNEVNAHPHFDEKSSLAIVHNGIIENYDELRKMLKKKGISFKSETDTEVIAQLIANYYKTDLIEAVLESIKELKGSFAIAVIHKNHPDSIIAVSRESPLVVGYDEEKKEAFISSDVNAFLGRTLNVIYLKNDEIANLTKNGIFISHLSGKSVTSKVEKFEGEGKAPSKGNFSHFMLKEIFEQPDTIKKAMENHILDDFGTAHFEELSSLSKELLATRHILIIACGTSYHASSIAALLLEQMARIPTQAEIASELRFKNPIISNETLVIAVSQSGETADTIAALREAKAKGAKILGICNVKNSTLSREADSTIFLNAGPEMSVCSTKAFTSQLSVLLLFTLYMARLRHMSKEEGQLFLFEMQKMPKIIEEVLSQSKTIENLAKKYSHYFSFFFVGRSYMVPTALEGALKLKEISYLNATGLPAGELKHGPIALLSKNFPVIAFCCSRLTHDKMISNLQEIKARKAPILAIAYEGSDQIKEIATDTLFLPQTLDELSTLSSSVAAQLFAYFVAKEIGTEIDHPRNLAKSVTVE